MSARVDFEIPADRYVVFNGIPMFKSDACRSCDQRIVWIKHPRTHSNMPLDVSTVEARDGKLYALSHHATCPQAANWRKKRKPTP